MKQLLACVLTLAILLSMLPHTSPAVYAQEDASADNALAGKIIACVGDSITAAYGVTKDENDYVTLLAEQLGMDYIRLGASGTTLCTDGSRTCNIGKLTEANLQGADIVTIAMGINDFCAAAEGYYELGDIHSTDSSTIYGAARMWCERIEELRKNESLRHTQFYFLTPIITSWNSSVTSQRDWDQSKTNIHGYTLRDLCNAIIDVAALYDVAVMDLNLLSGMYYVDAEDNNTAVFGGDGVHPGVKGHEMMAAAMANILLQNDLRDDHTHTFGSWITTTWPSCSAGEQKRVCTICSATQSRTLESGDSHSYRAVVTLPTYTGQGYTTYTCSRCGDSYVSDYTDPIAPNSYRWEMRDNALVSVTAGGNAANALTQTSGSITGGTLANVRYCLQEPIRLRHDKSWVIEWRSSGNWDGMLLGSTMDSSVQGLTYLFRYAPMNFLALGEYTGAWNNYGIVHAIDMTASHVFRLENRVGPDGTNTVYLLVDGREIDGMYHYYVGGTNQNKTVNWANGKDIVFSNIGTSSHPVSGMQLEYLQVWENGHVHTYESAVTAPTCTAAGYTTYTCACGDSYIDDEAAATGHSYANGICTDCGAEHSNLANYEGKVISVLGDSISTFAGYIPTADGFNLEHLARYPQDDLLTDVNETWWMQVISACGAKLGINDSWRGATVSGAVPVTTGSTGEKAAMGNLQRIQNLGANGTPDVILFYGGTNDLAHVPKVGTFDASGAPSAVDLTTGKWDNLADGYVHTLLRLQYFYPDAQIVALLPAYTNGYYSNEKLAEGNAVLAAICEHYGITYVDLRECGISCANLPDNIHPDATGMDYISAAVMDALLYACEMEAGENVVHPVTHELTCAQSSMGYYKGVSHGKSFCAAITGEDISVSVTMNGADITGECYADGEITIAEVTGALVIKAEGACPLKEHIQPLPDSYCGVNLWKALEHDPEYYSADGWTIHSSNQVKSITVPVRPGDRIYASSFGAAGNNGGSMNGIRVTYFKDTGLLVSMTADQVYSEFSKNGCLTVPEGAAAISIPMWTDSQDWDVHFLCALEGHLQPVPEGLCSNTNLWSVLEHDTQYYSADGWTTHSSGSVKSVTFPAAAGDRLFASSFGAMGTNGGTINGIRVTYFTQCGVLVSLTADQVYSEFRENGYLTVPEGAAAVNVPMWNNSGENKSYILNRDHCYANGICYLCGAEDPDYVEPAERFDLFGANVILGNDLTMNFCWLASHISGTDYYAEIVRYNPDGTTVTTTYPFSEWSPYANGAMYRIALDGLAAKQMSDRLEVTIYTGDGVPVSNTWVDSIRDYAIRQLNNSANAGKVYTVVADMLNYGAAAQIQFAYNTGDLANATMTDAHKAYATASLDFADYTNNQVVGDNFFGTILALETNIQMGVFFKGVGYEGCTAKVSYRDHNGNTVSYEAAGKDFDTRYIAQGMYGILVDTLVAGDVYQLVTVEVYDGDTLVASAVESMESYLVRQSASALPIYEALMKFLVSSYHYSH